MIKAVLFDLDGTLVNTNEHIISALMLALEKVSKVRKTREEIALTFGIPLHKAIQGFDSENWALILKTYHEFANLKGFSDVTLFPSVKETLIELKKNQLKMAIVTSRKKENALSYLTHFELLSYFDEIIGPEDTKKHKPHPEPILLALEKLNVLATEALMVGDSPFDLQAANSAKVKSIGVSYTALPLERLYESKPTYMIDNLSELLPLIKKTP